MCSAREKEKESCNNSAVMKGRSKNNNLNAFYVNNYTCGYVFMYTKGGRRLGRVGNKRVQPTNGASHRNLFNFFWQPLSSSATFKQER